jgi:hypothetical protein
MDMLNLGGRRGDVYTDVTFVPCPVPWSTVELAYAYAAAQGASDAVTTGDAKRPDAVAGRMRFVELKNGAVALSGAEDSASFSLADYAHRHKSLLKWNLMVFKQFCRKEHAKSRPGQFASYRTLQLKACLIAY